MRVYEEPVAVRRGLVGAIEGPAEFRWRGRAWRVDEIECRAVTTGAWWDSAAARAVRGDGVPGVTAPAGDPAPDDGAPAHRPPDDGHDVLAEEEIWRVAAGRRVAVPRGADAALGERTGVFELTHTVATGAWRLSRVLD